MIVRYSETVAKQKIENEYKYLMNEWLDILNEYRKNQCCLVNSN